MATSGRYPPRPSSWGLAASGTGSGEAPSLVGWRVVSREGGAPVPFSGDPGAASERSICSWLGVVRGRGGSEEEGVFSGEREGFLEFSGAAARCGQVVALFAGGTGASSPLLVPDSAVWTCRGQAS